MSDETADPTPADTEEVTDSADVTSEVGDTASTEEARTDADTHPAAQAAKYRVKLRATESERDALSERLNTLQRREVERLAGEKMAQGDDIWLSGTDLADLIDEDGNVDAERVSEAVNGIVASKPHWAARPAPKPLRTGALKSGAAIAPPTTGWSDLLGRKE